MIYSKFKVWSNPLRNVQITKDFTKKEVWRKKLEQSIKEMGAQRIILFGSLAWRNVDVNSDLDLFVLMPSDRSGKEWADLIYSKIERKVSSHIIVFNQDEFQKEFPTNRFLQQMMRGKILYEKTL